MSVRKRWRWTNAIDKRNARSLKRSERNCWTTDIQTPRPRWKGYVNPLLLILVIIMVA